MHPRRFEFKDSVTERQRAGALQAHRLIETFIGFKAQRAVLSRNQGGVTFENAGLSAILELHKTRLLLRDVGAKKSQPFSCCYRLGIEKFDDESRISTLEYKGYLIVNIYVPNLHPHSAPDRLDFRGERDKTVKEYVPRAAKHDLS